MLRGLEKTKIVLRWLLKDESEREKDRTLQKESNFGSRERRIAMRDAICCCRRTEDGDLIRL